MMIIRDEPRLKEGEEDEESRMITDNHSLVKDDEINDLTTGSKASQHDLSKSASRRKQIKPNRVTNDDDGIPQQALIIDEGNDSTNGHQSSSEEYVSHSNTDSRPPQEQEAYCHLCERSFCNKYFLKTHCAKKHGLVNSASPLSQTENNDNGRVSLSPPSPCLSNEQALPLVVNQQSSPETNKSLEKISEDYCEICQKHFCNKYYLRKHKGECHGIYTDYIKSLQKSTSESPSKAAAAGSHRLSTSTPTPSNTLLLNPFYPGPSDMKSLFPIPSSTSHLSNGSTSNSISSQRIPRRCTQCHQEFRTKSLLRAHTTTCHAQDKTPKKILPTSNLGFLQPFLDTTSQLAHKVISGQTSQNSYGIVPDAYFCAKMADRVVCEICNKQVCNKYFLKTHKAKVHGITHTDVQEPTNENADTYCSLCKKDFSTKYLYLFHMQTVHQDTSDPTYHTFLEFLKTAKSMTDSATIEPFDSQPEDDEADGHIERLQRKRSLSHSPAENSTAKRSHASIEPNNNAGLQPFLLESEDPNFSHTFVPCMVYLPVIRRVTKQIKINLRLKPVLGDTSA